MGRWHRNFGMAWMTAAAAVLAGCPAAAPSSIGMPAGNEHALLTPAIGPGEAPAPGASAAPTTAPGASAAPAVVPSPSSLGAPQPTQQAPLKAGAVDDNATFADYISYLTQYGGPAMRRLDITEAATRPPVAVGRRAPRPTSSARGGSTTSWSTSSNPSSIA